MPTKRIAAAQVVARAAELPEQLGPIRDWMESFAGDAWTEGGGELMLCRRPEVAPEAFALVLFDSASQDELSKYAADRQLDIPMAIASMLHAVNGFYFFDLSFYGARFVFNRTSRGPLDIATAARNWRAEFSHGKDEFHFASRNVGWDEQIGYFLRSDLSVAGYYRRSKPTQVAGSWVSLTDWLGSEAAAPTKSLSSH